MFLIITCEHAANVVPSEYSYLFQKDLPRLSTHQGYDIGAKKVARALAKSFHAPYFEHDITRLLVDVNRSLSSKSLFYYSLKKGEQNEILTKYYFPYRHKVEDEIANLIASHHQVLHLSIHSFTPVLHGVMRNADIGLLYDPSRFQERRHSEKIINYLKANTYLTMRRNYPYLGASDGLVTHLRKLFTSQDYVGIEIEINQRLLEAGMRVQDPLKNAIQCLL